MIVAIFYQNNLIKNVYDYVYLGAKVIKMILNQITIYNIQNHI